MASRTTTLNDRIPNPIRKTKVQNMRHALDGAAKRQGMAASVSNTLSHMLVALDGINGNEMPDSKSMVQKLLDNPNFVKEFSACIRRYAPDLLDAFEEMAGTKTEGVEGSGKVANAEGEADTTEGAANEAAEGSPTNAHMSTPEEEQRNQQIAEEQGLTGAGYPTRGANNERGMDAMNAYFAPRGDVHASMDDVFRDPDAKSLDSYFK
ncbi:hypothetical protein [Paraburkholderia caribensis]|uniref:hypothetical protein n=1 Tax=Paraburkholderia caribensis TaxID=75105 RepID=UPI001CB5A2FF|nr:hypothetical protein [Paraburkholderia caribensis]CAG9249970.1 hypothetical protein PCAR4_260091 [Paraburkholderia caribensis]